VIISCGDQIPGRKPYRTLPGGAARGRKISPVQSPTWWRWWYRIPGENSISAGHGNVHATTPAARLPDGMQPW